MKGKSFDYHVLDLVLFKLLKKPYDEPLLALMRANQYLVELDDDLFDYETDVGRNSFNILRCYVALYGEEASKHLISYIGALEAEHKQLLEEVTPAQKSAHIAQERTTMSRTGANTWVIPTLILDE